MKKITEKDLLIRQNDLLMHLLESDVELARAHQRTEYLIMIMSFLILSYTSDFLIAEILFLLFAFVTILGEYKIRKRHEEFRKQSKH